MKVYLVIISILIAKVSSGQRGLIDTKYFTIETPSDWHYIEQHGIDSFVGIIKGPKIMLEFDFSDLGYAGLNVKDPDEYIRKEIKYKYSKLFNEPNILYTSPEDVEVRRNYLRESGKVGVMPYINPTTKIRKPQIIDLEKYENVDFLIEVTHKDSTITVPVVIPEETKRHNFKIDTIGNYIITIIWPKKVRKGLTGVYFRKKNSSFTFQMHGENLSLKEQELALKAFSTILIKKD